MHVLIGINLNISSGLRPGVIYGTLQVIWMLVHLKKVIKISQMLTRLWTRKFIFIYSSLLARDIKYNVEHILWSELYTWIEKYGNYKSLFVFSVKILLYYIFKYFFFFFLWNSSFWNDILIGRMVILSPKVEILGQWKELVWKLLWKFNFIFII